MARLIIDKQFDQQVWQTETEFDDKKYNEWLQHAKEQLIKARELVDDDIDQGCVYAEEIDTNILGDLINMLDVIKVEKINK